MTRFHLCGCIFEANFAFDIPYLLIQNFTSNISFSLTKLCLACNVILPSKIFQEIYLS